MKKSCSLTFLLGGLLLLPTLAFAFTWTELPGPATPKNPAIYSIASVTSTDVWSVGGGNNGKNVLIEHWDGAAWSVVPSSVRSGQLFAVTARTTDDVWAVGSQTVGSSVLTLVEHWDGTTWKAVPSPNIGTYDELNGVSIVSNDDIWAVGASGPIAGDYILMHWDGNAWSLVSGPVANSATLLGVKAFATDNVWAVGYKDFVYNNNTASTFIIHWDGASWSEVDSPSVAAYNDLSAIDGAAPDDIWALGGSVDASFAKQTVALHWNGTAWTVVPTPANGGTFTGVKVINSTKVLAVGNVISSSPFAELWDGKKWRHIPTPTFSGLLFGVTYADKVAFAAGYQYLDFGDIDELFLMSRRSQ